MIRREVVCAPCGEDPLTGLIAEARLPFDLA
jgi:hypothetical protein